MVTDDCEEECSGNGICMDGSCVCVAGFVPPTCAERYVSSVVQPGCKEEGADGDNPKMVCRVQTPEEAATEAIEAIKAVETAAESGASMRFRETNHTDIKSMITFRTEDSPSVAPLYHQALKAEYQLHHSEPRPIVTFTDNKTRCLNGCNGQGECVVNRC